MERGIENAAFIFPNAPTELLNRHYPFVLRPKYHSSPSDHLHMHQTVIISITFMRPLPHVNSKKHLGVIGCKALPKTRGKALHGVMRNFQHHGLGFVIPVRSERTMRLIGYADLTCLRWNPQSLQR